MLGTDMWSFTYTFELPEGEEAAVDSPTTTDLSGFGVEALDGSIGKVDDATYEMGTSAVVVDTGPWIFGKKVMLPAGVIDWVDVDAEKVYVHRTKDEIKGAPEYDDSLRHDEGYRSDLGSYYGPDGRGYRVPEERSRPW